LVLAWEPHPKSGVRSGSPPKKLLDAIKAAGGVVVDTSVGRVKPGVWIDEQLDDAPVKLTKDARDLVAATLGEDLSRLVGLLPLLAGAYGERARLGVEEVEPYLGEQGGVKPWDLTDAIDGGRTAAAVSMLQRMLANGMHPLQVLAMLTNHVLRMVALDGSGVPDERAAAELLGIKGSPFPAKKALRQAQKLGSDRLREFTQLLAQADLDLKGAKQLPSELVVEVLVARLASRSRR
jgi:DNA polymerase-3 subunit delta